MSVSHPLLICGRLGARVPWAVEKPNCPLIVTPMRCQRGAPALSLGLLIAANLSFPPFRGRLRLKGAYVGVTAVEILLQLPRRGEQRVGNLNVFGLNDSICLTQPGLVFLKKRLPLSIRQPESQFSLFAEVAEHMTVQRRVRHGR